jgi:hypothetical protein
MAFQNGAPKIISLQFLHPKRVFELGLIFYPEDGGRQRVPPRRLQIYTRLHGVISPNIYICLIYHHDHLISRILGLTKTCLRQDKVI